MQIIRPLSTPGIGAQYPEALPPVTPENAGVQIGVGMQKAYLVYRSNWNEREPSKSGWQYQYTHYEKELTRAELLERIAHLEREVQRLDNEADSFARQLSHGGLPSYTLPEA